MSLLQVLDYVDVVIETQKLYLFPSPHDGQHPMNIELSLLRAFETRAWLSFELGLVSGS